MNGREQLVSIAESVRTEFSSLEEQLLEIDWQMADVVQKILVLKGEEPGFRTAVERVSHNPEQYTKEEIITVFQRFVDLQMYLTSLLEQRSHLEGKKRDLDKKLVRLMETAENAESIAENPQQKQVLGLQIIRAQEEERRRMARDIHDGPAQSMANVVFRMEFCEKLLDVEPEKVREELRELKDIVRNNLQDVRKIIFDLRPMALDDLGVVPALKRYIGNVAESNKIDINLNFIGRENRLESSLEIALFRLVQEALNNVVKHADANSVKLTLEMKPDYVTTTVEDDGKGFNFSRIAFGDHGSHFGLISMRERVGLLGGEMEIDTHPGQGTRIVFRLPVSDRNQT